MKRKTELGIIRAVGCLVRGVNYGTDSLVRGVSYGTDSFILFWIE